MKTSVSAIALASSLVACGNGAPREQSATIHQRSEPSRLTAAVVNGPIDLGTLGGKFSWAEGINALGQVIGTADTGAGIGPGAFVLHAFLWQSGTGMIDLGTVGGTHSWAIAINDRGQVTGRSQVRPYAYDEHAFLWEIGTGMIDLGTLGGSESRPIAINERGQVVGVSTTPGNAQTHAFLWEKGTGMIDLGTLGNGESRPYAINGLGQVTGTIRTGFNLRAFLWQSGTGMTILGSLGGVFDIPSAINDAGQIVGSSRMPDIGETHLVLWQNGTTTDLGTLGGLSATGKDINEKGQIVGTSDNGADDQWSHAFLWQSTTGMVDLGTWGGSNYGTAIAINNQTEVVGWGYTLDGWMRGFLWQSGTGMTDLGMLASGISGTPSAINDKGQIVGANLVASGDRRAVLWTIVRPLTPAEQIAALTDAVNNLAAAGKLKRGNAQSVLAKLDNAARQLTQGHENVAAQMLGQFVQKVAELVAGGALSNSDGQALIDAARKVIDQLTT